MKNYRFQVEFPSSRYSSGYSRKSGDCSTRSQTSVRLIVVPSSSSSSSQSDDFNRFSQGNPEDKQKSQIWASQSIPLNSPNP